MTVFTIISLLAGFSSTETHWKSVTVGTAADEMNLLFFSNKHIFYVNYLTNTSASLTSIENSSNPNISQQLHTAELTSPGIYRVHLGLCTG